MSILSTAGSSTASYVRVLGAGFLTVLLATSFGCATMQEMGGGGGDTAAAEGEKAPEAAPANEAKQVLPIPAGSALAKVSAGMSDVEVNKVLGAADHTRHYPTWKAWMPYYYGSDTHRIDWRYEGVGKVIFSSNRYSGKLKVVQVVYNPNEMK